MKQPEQKIRWCCVDIESTGFDPLENEIIEVGFAFFELTADGFIVTDQWSQVFKPFREVQPKILGLTGITQEELDAAPRFAEFKDALQEHLGNCILVGHSVAMDVSFLEAAGLKLSGLTVDTLDFVQMFLPTHHSYNLENLVHTLRLPNTRSHRALADSLATIALLERMLQGFWALPEEVREQMHKLFPQGHALWPRLFATPLPAQALELPVPPEVHVQTTQSVSLQPRTWLEVPLDQNLDAVVLASLTSKSENTICLLPDLTKVFTAWQKGLGQGVFLPEDTFNEPAFNALLEQTHSDPLLVKFLLKVLVWKTTNWQTQCVLDLNISFFGGQYKHVITGGTPPLTAHASVFISDFRTFLRGREFGLPLYDRKVVVCGVQHFENAVSNFLGFRVSWSYVVHRLESFYYQALTSGDTEASTEAQRLINATDLFFAVLQLTLRKLYGMQHAISWKKFKNSGVPFTQVHTALRHYENKLESFLARFKIIELEKSLEGLNQFSSGLDQSLDMWVELDEHKCVLAAVPEHFDARGLLGESVVMVEYELPADLRNYYLERFGVGEYTLQTNIELEKWQWVREPGSVSHDMLLELIRKDTVPLVIVFTSPVQIKRFYDQYYRHIQDRAVLYAQGYSGGSNKMIHNFKLSGNGVLLITPGFVQKLQRARIPVKTLIIAQKLSGESMKPHFGTHPEAERLAELAELQLLLRVFGGSKLETIYSYLSSSVFKSK